MVRVRRAHVFVLDPNDAQRSALERMADGRRAAYNFGRALDRDLYAADLPPADWADLEPNWAAPRWNERRALDAWGMGPLWSRSWRTLPSYVAPAAGQSAQIAFADYTAARDAAIKRRRGFPRFRSRADPHQGFTVRGVTVHGDALHLTNVGMVRVKGSTRRLRWFLEHRDGEIKLAHLVRAGVHAPWRAVVIVEIEQPEAAAHPGPVVGLDLGLHRFATLSDGQIIENPRILNTALRRLRHTSKAVSRSEQARQAREVAARAADTLGARQRLPKSHRHLTKEARVARLHARVAALRGEFHHHLAKRLVAQYSAIGVEDLNVAGMTRNHRLARHIGDVGWSSFRRILDYKAEDAGSLVVRADRWFPSSQRCADCGARNRAVKDLGLRQWACPACGVVHDRDENAARNLVPTESQIAAARAARRAAHSKQHQRRQAQQERAIRAATTKREARLLRHQTRLARPASRPPTPVADTSSETLTARRDPVRPKATTPVVAAVARIATPLRREEARTEPSGLPIAVVSSGISLGALGPPAAMPCASSA